MADTIAAVPSRMQAEATFEAACLRARFASRELDEAMRWGYFDPQRLVVARNSARYAFDALVAATRDVTSR